MQDRLQALYCTMCTQTQQHGMFICRVQTSRSERFAYGTALTSVHVPCVSTQHSLSNTAERLRMLLHNQRLPGARFACIGKAHSCALHHQRMHAVRMRVHTKSSPQHTQKQKEEKGKRTMRACMYRQPSLTLNSVFRNTHRAWLR